VIREPASRRFAERNWRIPPCGPSSTLTLGWFSHFPSALSAIEPGKVLDAMTAVTFSVTPRACTRDLVLAAQSGDRAAFGSLFERFEPRVFALALRRLGRFCEAEELSQDVFVQVLEKIGQLREPESFGGWVRSIARRMAINRLVRRRRVVPVDPDTLDGTGVENAAPEARLVEAERDGQLRASLLRLGSLDRNTLTAFYLEGRSLLEMSDRFEAPLGTIKRRLHVARKRLAKEAESLLAV
jgi:RNA polymerase sigma-70 factor (ECF subfamily)